jgi:hypothetical protein
MRATLLNRLVTASRERPRARIRWSTAWFSVAFDYLAHYAALLAD